jgi:hypothetical protein
LHKDIQGIFLSSAGFPKTHYFYTLLLQMKYLFTALLFCSLFSCTKPAADTTPVVEPPTGPVSRFTITFNGKTYNETIDDAHPIEINSIFKGKNPTSGINEYQFQIFWETRNLIISLLGQKSDTSTQLGDYTTSLTNGKPPKPVSSPNTIWVLGDTTKPYIGDNKSTVTITSSTPTEFKGTMNFTLQNDGIIYPASGDFELYR